MFSASPPGAFLIARSILSLGMLSPRACQDRQRAGARKLVLRGRAGPRLAACRDFAGRELGEQLGAFPLSCRPLRNPMMFFELGMTGHLLSE